MDEKQDEDGLRAMLAGLAPEPHARRSVPTELRQRIRSDYDAIKEARTREVTWQQITAAMIAAGVRTADGDEPHWRAVMSAFHAERYSRGEKRKRRRAGKAGSSKREVAQAEPAPPLSSPDQRSEEARSPDPDPAEAERMARMRAAMERNRPREPLAQSSDDFLKNPGWRKESGE